MAKLSLVRSFQFFQNLKDISWLVIGIELVQPDNYIRLKPEFEVRTGGYLIFLAATPLEACRFSHISIRSLG